MSKHYQVLARKYRPHSFKELVGQMHTVQTLINALDANNLHHGFLFTGTRGVGKTTIARIFAKSINCENGVSSTPCGKCSTCIEIDKGQSVDLIELDAASHTGVDNMREILENAQYMPTKNRYKIYLIDEVHMLSKSSFNALLKTLEEPPEHIKFLLATTDPQKLPVTVLSRCLQFNLQKLTDSEISGQLKYIMQNESLDFEEDALNQIARFGQGSMRDALSLLDQSISYGNGTVLVKDIKAMLGLVSHDDIIKLATHLFNQNANEVIEFIRDISHRGDNLTNALNDLSSLFHRISIAKTVSSTSIEDEISLLSSKISAQDLQVFYQISINGVKDMPLAPSEQIGMEMTLLRMLSFHTDITNYTEKKTVKIKPKSVTKIQTDNITDAKNFSSSDTNSKLGILNNDSWEQLTPTLKLSSAAIIIVKNTIIESHSSNLLTLTLDKEFSGLLTQRIQSEIEKALKICLGNVTLKIVLNKPKFKTIAQKEQHAKNAKNAKLQERFINDTTVKKIEQIFNSKIDMKSIKEI
jgi:DNA polymerase-3 subunit gamma/tau